MILELCKSNSLRILNGRATGDESGTFTRYPKRRSENPSAIDYTLCGEALIPSIFSFSVLPYTELSDHCCISTHIKINRAMDREGTPQENVNHILLKIIQGLFSKNVYPTEWTSNFL